MSGAATLAAFMRSRKLSQGELAALLGLSEGYVSLLLSQQRKPGLAVAFRIEKLTDGQVAASSWLPPSRGKRRSPAKGRRIVPRPRHAARVVRADLRSHD